MNFSRSTIVVFIFLVLNAELLFASPPPPPPPPPGLPIDGGLSFLVLSGVIYGVYEALKRR